MVKRSWLLLFIVACEPPSILPPNDDSTEQSSTSVEQQNTPAPTGPTSITEPPMPTPVAPTEPEPQAPTEPPAEPEPEEPPAPSITSFLASATEVVSGTDVTLSWTTANASAIALNGNATTATSVTVQPQATTTYVLRASTNTDWIEESITIVVTEAPDPPDPAPTITSFTAAPSSITEGESTTLSWTATGTLTINNGGISGASQVVSPTTTTKYTLKATTGSGTITQEVTVTVVAKPVITSFSASPLSITTGASSTLTWNATGTLTINNAAVSGTTKTVSPTATTTYTLKAVNALGYAVSLARTVTVTAPPAAVTHDLFVDSYVNGWKRDSEWFSSAGSYAVTNGMIHLTANGSATYLGLQLSTTAPITAATYARINITAKGSGTLSFETATGYEEIDLSPNFSVYSIAVSKLWSGSIGSFAIKNVTASADVYIDSIQFGPAPAPQGCVNQAPANALTIAHGTRTAFTTADNITHWVWVPSDYDTTCHSKPKKLFVWLHGCGGQGFYDIAQVRPTGNEDWIALAVGGAESTCWSSSTAVGSTASPGIVMRAIADVKTRLAIKDKEIIIGGYSSGGDVGYPIIFKNSKTFALALFENTAPSNAATLVNSAAPPNGWRFPVRHLCHASDEIASYKCSALTGVIGTGGVFANAGHSSVLHEMDGTHWQADSNGRGTWADFNATLRPYLSMNWTSP